jgi:hypothetical protein
MKKPSRIYADVHKLQISAPEQTQGFATVSEVARWIKNERCGFTNVVR